jgi:hypothetical protein
MNYAMRIKHTTSAYYSIVSLGIELSCNKSGYSIIPPILAFGIRFAIAGAALLVAYVVNERRMDSCPYDWQYVHFPSQK